MRQTEHRLANAQLSNINMHMISINKLACACVGDVTWEMQTWETRNDFPFGCLQKTNATGHKNEQGEAEKAEKVCLGGTTLPDAASTLLRE